MKKIFFLGLLLIILGSACGSAVGVRENTPGSAVEVTVYKSPN